MPNLRSVCANSLAISSFSKTHHVDKTFCTDKGIIRAFKALYTRLDEEDGLTLGRLAIMLGMATELQRAAQEWDPLMSRSLQFSNIIDGGMSVYKDLFAQKRKKRQQLPITMFFSRKNTHAPRASEEENAAVRSQDAAARSEKQ